MSTAPTSPRADDETFDAWTDRCEADLIAAYEAGAFAPFALLSGPRGPLTLFLEPGESDEFFFRRVRQVAVDTGATGFVGATTGQLAMGPFEAVVVLLWYVSQDGCQAHGLGQVFERKVYTRHRSDPNKAPRAMRSVLG